MQIASILFAWCAWTIEDYTARWLCYGQFVVRKWRDRNAAPTYGAMLACGDSQDWIYFETEFTSTHFRPLQDIPSLPKKFQMVVMKKIPTGNPTCPPFVWSAEKIFNSLVNKCNITSHECICNSVDNNTMLDPVEENNSNQGNMENRRMKQRLMWNQPKWSLFLMLWILYQHMTVTPLQAWIHCQGW